ncbi:hypothetical protein [Silicimonas sp. MF1-12-2]|jgi:hypothetical protein|uniref:hypothetical protein n=1 Tax=Silicimonas sp. MF1-12-2 TaxID=3384793 RepID=UPI0039B38F14
MALGLGRRIYRERRRLLFVTSLAFLAGYIFYLRAGHEVWGLPVPVVTGAIYAGVVGPTALFFCLVLPSIRFMIEAIAVSRLLFSIFVFSVPDIGYSILASPFLTAFVVVTGGIVVSRVIHGRIQKTRTRAWREKLNLARLVTRTPARLSGRAWQHRFVGWIDDTQPLPA